MKPFIAILVLAYIFTGAPSVAAGRPMDIVNKSIIAINKRDMKGFAALCTQDAIAIDNFTPHIWRDNGCAGWASGYVAVMRSDGDIGGIFTLGTPKRDDVSRDRAYIVVPAKFTYSEKGKPGRVLGLLTYVMKRTTAGWQIAAWVFSEEG